MVKRAVLSREGESYIKRGSHIAEDMFLKPADSLERLVSAEGTPQYPFGMQSAEDG
jgi:hypothetical protein